jgi:hypothetical protein
LRLLDLVVVENLVRNGELLGWAQGVVGCRSGLWDWERGCGVGGRGVVGLKVMRKEREKP